MSEEKQKNYNTAYNLGKAFANKQWELKVKGKIEELKSKSGGNVFHIQQTINAEIRLLQELLEKNRIS